MTWTARLKLIAGALIVLLIVAAATLVFNQRQTKVLSSTAQITAARYPVGTDYGGLVVESYVEEGDAVAEGDRMYAVESLALERDIAQGLVDPGSDLVTDQDWLIVRASVDGTVSDVELDTGAYAGAGSVLATIDRAGTLIAVADFVLSPRDFGRLENDGSAELRLPDGTAIPGTVQDIEVTTVEGEAHVTATITSDHLVAGDALVVPGTPLEATMHLRDDGPLAGASDALGDLARRVGL